MNQELSDAQILQHWMLQTPPAPEELTEDDVLFAQLATATINDYHQALAYLPFQFGKNDLCGFYAMDNGWQATMEAIKRGVAVLNGYILVYNERVPVYRNAEGHKDAIVSRHQGAGYLATTEMHRLISLIPVGKLMTMTEAAKLIYGSDARSKLVMLREAIQEGYLHAFRDPNENNPQKWTRVSHFEAVRFKVRRENKP